MLKVTGRGRLIDGYDGGAVAYDSLAASILTGRAHRAGCCVAGASRYRCRQCRDVVRIAPMQTDHRNIRRNGDACADPQRHGDDEKPQGAALLVV